jgi:hypothetical protein
VSSRRRWLPLTVAVAGAVTFSTPFGLLLGPPAYAQTGKVEREPTQAELAAQDQEVAELRARAEARTGEVKDARQATQAAATLAGQALEAYSATVRGLQAAQDEEDQSDQELEQANDDAQDARRRIGLWARQAYQGGSGLNASPALNTLLGTNGAALDGAGLSAAMHTLQRIGENRSADLNAGYRAEARAERAAATAAKATERATQAANAADAAETAADSAVAQQRRLLDEAEADLDTTSSQVRAAEKRQQRLRTLRSRSARRAAGSNVVTGQVGSCAGASDISSYPNGEIPISALCPLAGAPGHYLRADAAYAFDQLSTAYAEQFGGPICVTDSYRDYATQVRLYATKPNLAAKPGTSNHGWGTATDLCGGIQNFGTAEHEWLFVNAPLFGWFHPAWAQPDGSRPEPWHWEFGG